MVVVANDVTSAATTINNNMTKTTKKRNKPGGGSASKLFNKFDSDRTYDPFLDPDFVIQDSKEGMETLLSMCNAVELNSLCGALGFVEPCPRNAKANLVMSFIREGGRQVQKRFAEVLRLFWEGLLFEYLRSVGCPLRDAEHDPRHFVTRYWRRSLLDPSLRPGFVPFYLTREVKKRSTIVQEDRDIQDIRAGLITREQVVKDAETKVRRQHDYRFVLQYFSASRDLHRTLVGNVTYLANEVEQLRANMDHSTESISIMEKQFVELETKYDRVVGGFVHRGAFQLTVEGALYSMINQGHATVKAAEHLARQLLEDMEVGPAFCDGNRGRRGVSNIAPLRSQGIQHANTGVGFSEDTQHGGQDDKHSSEEVPAVVSDGANKETWVAPRSQQGFDIVGVSSSTKDPSPKATATATMEVALPVCCSNSKAYEGAESGHNDLASCLAQVQETHRRACKRYARLVAELEERNASLAAAAAEAVKDKAGALVQAQEWEARHTVLEERLAEVESRSTDELALAEERARDANWRALEATALMKEGLDKATPTLVDMVAAFLPRDTEELGVGLFQNLGIDPDLYVHLLAKKSMFKADLESRAFEAVSGEQMREAATENIDEHEEANTASGKKERGRPRSRGQGSGKGEKSGKSGGKSRSKSTTGGKVAKSGDKRDKGKGTGKAAADKSDKSKGGKAGEKSTSSRKKSTSPSKGSGVEKDGVSSDQKKGGGKNKDAKRSSSPAKKVVSKKKKK